MDTPIWVTIVVAVIAAVVGYFGNELTSRRQRDQAREQSDRDWLEKAATLCRSRDPKEREHGLGFLRALIRLPEIDRRVQDLLDEMTQQELGHTLAAARQGRRGDRSAAGHRRGGAERCGYRDRVPAGGGDGAWPRRRSR